MKNRFSRTPQPPYYAVIFTAQLSNYVQGYDQMAQTMYDLALEQPGCLGSESTRDSDGIGITVSYWKDETSIVAWKNVSEHLLAQKMGMKRWYEHYELRVAKVERAYSGPAERPAVITGPEQT